MSLATLRLLLNRLSAPPAVRNVEEERGGSLVRVASDVTFHARIRSTRLLCRPVPLHTKKHVRAGRDPRSLRPPSDRHLPCRTKFGASLHILGERHVPGGRAPNVGNVESAHGEHYGSRIVFDFHRQFDFPRTLGLLLIVRSRARIHCGFSACLVQHAVECTSIVS